MTPLGRKAVLVLAVAALSLASAAAGGTLGFLHGYAYGIGRNASDANALVASLRALRARDVGKAVSLLESTLDTLIVEHAAVDPNNHSIFTLAFPELRDDTADRGLFERVARYRAEFPSQAIVPEVRDLIASHLKGYQPR